MSRTAGLESETADDDDREPAADDRNERTDADRINDRNERTDADRINDRNERTDADRTDGHLDDLPDGAGCTEIWEHLSAGRADDA